MDLAQRLAPVDCAVIADEDLAILVQSQSSPWPGAFRELRTRHYSWIYGFVSRLADEKRLSPEDTEDAQQDIVPAFHQALLDYIPDRGRSRRPGSFRAYLRSAITHSFSKSLRRLRLRQRLSRHPAAVQQQLHGFSVLVEAKRGNGRLASREKEPETAAEQRELFEDLEALLGRYGPNGQRLWEGRAHKQALQALALQLGESLSQTRRCWLLLRAQVRTGLRKHMDP